MVRRFTDFGAEEHWRITDFGAEEHWIYCILIYALFLSIGLTNVLFLLFVSRKQAKSTFALPSLFLRFLSLKIAMSYKSYSGGTAFTS